MCKYAQVIIQFAKTQEIDRLFTYSVPSALRDKIQIGMRVRVPFGRRSPVQIGFVVGLTDVPPDETYRLKDLIDFYDEVPLFNEDQVKIARFMTEYYGCTYAMALEVMVPPGLSKTPYMVRKQAVSVVRSLLDQQQLKTYITLHQHKKSFLKQQALLSVFFNRREVLLEDIKADDTLSIGSLTTLIKNQLLVKEEKEIVFVPDVVNKHLFKTLSEEQLVAKQAIDHAIAKDAYTGFLLEGVTGSGKTEVFLSAIDKVLDKGGSAIVLVPEIALTRQTLLRFEERFGNRVALTHSRMTPVERQQLYSKAQEGKIQVMIGPRSAVFMPMQNLELIIVDEEHETTYKSETTPKYHAIDVAQMRMVQQKGVLILASATPSFESYYKIEQGHLEHLKLTRRIGRARLPEVHIVDMRKELQQGNMQIISRRLHEALEEHLKAGNQVMILLNRRGHSTFVNCRNCGFVVKCNHCDIAMTYHRHSGLLECHYCGYKVPIPTTCPSCGSKYIRFFGSGTEKVEEYLNRYFEDYGIGRMDLDTTSGKYGHNKVLEQFQNRTFNVLVGTQMIAKGHDFPDVTLVGIVAADQSLYMQDFRSEEKTFQLLTQALGRAGRGEKKGEVVIQTYNPEHLVLEKIKYFKQDSFYEEELKMRKMLGYPPYTHLFALTILGKDEKEVISIAHRLKYYYEYYNKKGLFRIIGPSSAVISRVADEYRWQLLLIGDEREKVLIYGKYCLNKFINRENTDTIKINWDIDPVHMI